MTEARKIGRVIPETTDTAVAIIADHNHTSMQLARAIALRTVPYLAPLAGANTGMETIEVVGAHYRNQLNALGEYTDTLIDLAREMQSICLAPVERDGL
ncbi:hypothetical protein ACVWZZ_001473 [Bradyrhizobium sp. LM6.10]|jgi:hypothetical protein